MSANHTPGPWFHESADRGNRYVIRFKAPHYTGRGDILAQHIERRDDALLIAAAPELADALEAARFWVAPDTASDRYLLLVGQGTPSLNDGKRLHEAIFKKLTALTERIDAALRAAGRLP